jgi:hypothetical protein
MAEVLVQFTDPVVDEDDRVFVARACGRKMADGRWEGWIEFLPTEGGEALRTGRETIQPNRDNALYWATGLTVVYLEGALARALRPAVRVPDDAFIPPPVYDSPADETVQPGSAAGSILNPFSVFRKGEVLLRSQLAALSPRHLVNIIQAHNLSDHDVAELNRMTSAELIETIVTAVRTHMDPAAS